MAKENKIKKPIYKKWWFWLIIAFIIIGIIGSKDNTNSSLTPDTENNSVSDAVNSEAVPNPSEAPSSESVVLTDKEEIEKILTDRITEEYTFTDIDSITINDDLGTDEDGDYIALVYLTWNQKNSGKTSKEVLKLYSDDLAATLAEQNDTVKELAVFWTVPYLNDSAKCSYERISGGFTEMDMAWGNAFN